MELERVVPLRETIMPLLWVESSDPEAVESSLLSNSHIKSVEVLTTAGTGRLFEIHWSPPAEGLTEALLNTSATILDARGTAEKLGLPAPVFGPRGPLGVQRRAHRLRDPGHAPADPPSAPGRGRPADIAGPTRDASDSLSAGVLRDPATDQPGRPRGGTGDQRQRTLPADQARRLEVDRAGRPLGGGALRMTRAVSRRNDRFAGVSRPRSGSVRRATRSGRPRFSRGIR